MTVMTTRAGGVRLRPYRDDDEPAVLDLLRRSLGEGPTGDRTARYFRWKHLDNPFGRSYLLVAEGESGVVGLRAFLRWRFTTGQGRTIRAVRAVDTATHPDHQGRGIFSLLTRHALEELRDATDLVFNTPNERSLPGYLKMGWEPVGPIPIAVRARRPLRVATNLRRLGPDHRPDRPRPEVDAPEVRTVIDLARPQLTAWAAGPSGLPGLSTERTAAFLEWRYAAAPLDYRGIWERPRSGRSGGIAIFRVRPRGRLWETTIAEVLVPDGDRRTIRTLLRRVARAASTDHLAAHVGAPGPLADGTHRHRFLSVPGGPMLVVNPLQPALAPEPRDPGSWSLTLGDVEVF